MDAPFLLFYSPDHDDYLLIIMTTTVTTTTNDPVRSARHRTALVQGGDRPLDAKKLEIHFDSSTDGRAVSGKYRKPRLEKKRTMVDKSDWMPTHYWILFRRGTTINIPPYLSGWAGYAEIGPSRW